MINKFFVVLLFLPIYKIVFWIMKNGINWTDKSNIRFSGKAHITCIDKSITMPLQQIRL